MIPASVKIEQEISLLKEDEKIEYLELLGMDEPVLNKIIFEGYKLLGLKKGCSKAEVLTAAKKLQQKIHPDLNREIRTERLSQLVNEATDKIIKTDFS